MAECWPVIDILVSLIAAVALLLRNDNDINKLQVSNLPVVTQVK